MQFRDRIKRFERIPAGQLRANPRNWRTHSDAQRAALAGVLAEVGIADACIAYETADGYELIDGHLRTGVMADELIPTLVLDVDADEANKLLLTLDPLAGMAGQDDAILRGLLHDVSTNSADLQGLLNTLEQSISVDGANAAAVTEDETPEPPADPITRPGDLWLLGDHRLLCGDSTNADDVARLMDVEKAALIHADPPYGMGKEKDGVANDNLYADKLDAFQMLWWRAFRKYAADNASAYIWGNAEDLWRLWYRGGLKDSERLTFRSQIIWDKPPTASSYGSPIGSDKMRSYPHGYEVCLFFMLGEQGFNNNADNYWDGWESIRSKLASDCEKMHWGPDDIKRFCGVGMYSHWFTRSQWTFIPEEHYQKLQAAAREHDAFKREYDELKREYDELKREFYATRAYFDNTHDNMTDVWEFGRVTGNDRHGHATPKPVDMMCRAIKSSLPKCGIVAEPFLGSGTTLIAAEQLNRKCYGMEISPTYCDVIVARWERLTGRKATREHEPTPS